MKIVDGTPTQKIIHARWRESRQRLRYLEQFSDTLPQFNLTLGERDRIRAQRMLHAAELCITRGQLRIAQSLLTRAYSTAARLAASELALNIAQTRVELENVLRNAPAIRLWSKRAGQWNSHIAKMALERARVRQLFYESVLSIHLDNRRVNFDQFVCEELRHIILPYHYCSLSRYSEALKALESYDIALTSSVYLREESLWLLFRIYCSTQQYDRAKKCIADMKNRMIVTPRIREYIRIGEAYNGMVTALNREGTPEPTRTHFMSWFVNSFYVVRQETSGMFLSVLVYELAYLLMNQEYTTANKRLAALRTRVCRLQADETLDELRVFMRVAGYALAMSHRHKRTMPRHLLDAFRTCSSYVPYPQQGIIPYADLAYKLLRYLGYR